MKTMKHFSILIAVFFGIATIMNVIQGRDVGMWATISSSLFFGGISLSYVWIYTIISKKLNDKNMLNKKPFLKE
tara:strand:- start:2602 stop:2823 length:222 start_codon:yes stop_codon:yes gene_type:complete